MSTEFSFEYKHKKFDQRKRSREEDEFSSKNSTTSVCDPATQPTSPYKQRRHYTTKQSIDEELPKRIQLININHVEPQLFPDIPASSTKLIEDRLCIKTESIEADVTVPDSVLPKRRRTIKTEQQNSVDLKIKDELIELNTCVPAIPREAYVEICKFRSNMVRQFPKKERSVKEQERRDKNTYACRKSRRVKKIEQVAVEEEYKGYKDANLRMAEYAIRATAYFKELMKMTEAAASDVIVID